MHSGGPPEKLCAIKEIGIHLAPNLGAQMLFSDHAKEELGRGIIRYHHLLRLNLGAIQ